MQPGEGQLHLRLDAHRPRYPKARRLPDQVVQQRGLAHARLTADHQHPALTGPDAIDELGERAHLAGPAPQRCGSSPWRRIRGHGRGYAAFVAAAVMSIATRRPGNAALRSAAWI